MKLNGHGVGRKLSSNQVKEKLIRKIKEGIKQGNSQIKTRTDDKRHLGRKVGNGIYLTPNLNMLENYSGIIKFNHENYRVALMAKVKINKIREPIDANYIYVLPSEGNFVRPYRILLKKIK